MEIRHKLSLQFSGLVALLLMAILSFNYYLAYQFARDSFFERLEEKASAIAAYHEGNEEPNTISSKPLPKQVLPSESILLFDLKGNKVFSFGKSSWAPSGALIRNLKNSGHLRMVEGERHIIGTTIIFDGEGLLLLASAVDEGGRSKLRNLAKSMLLSFLIFLIFVVLAGQYLSKKALEPIQSVISQVKQITARNLNQRLSHENNKDEITQLSSTFNSMLDRLESSFKTQSDFVRNSSHELRNPLAAMIGQAEIALRKERPADYYKEVIRKMFDESLRLKHIVNSLLNLSKASPENISKSMRVFRLDELLLDVVESITKTNPYRKIDVRLGHFGEKEPLLKGNQGLLEIALVNLLDNACKYSGNALVKCALYQDDNRFFLEIEDKGIGMNEEEILRITEPFYRSPKARTKEGFGIGMAVASKVFQVHGIQMTIESKPGMGTMVQLLIPGGLALHQEKAEG